MKLPNPDELRRTAVQFLIEGNEYNEATLLSSCSLEIGELRYVRGSVNEIDITLRCPRKIFEQLSPLKVSGWEEEPPLKLQLRHAVLAALPSGYGIANFDARAAGWTEVPEDLPNDVKEILTAAWKDHKSKTVDVNSEAAKNYLFVPLVRQESGRGLFRAVAGSFGIVQDYPENLTQEQSEAVGFVLDYLRDYNDIHDDLDPSQTLNCEREVSEKLQELERLGLWAFCGNYRAKQVYGNGTSMWEPLVVVVIAANKDPRIQQQPDGSFVIKAAIPKNATGVDDGSAAKHGNQPKAEKPAPPAEVQTVNRPKYLMRKAGSYWDIIYDSGELFHIDDSLGVRYLDYLLKTPGTPIHALKLEALVRPEKATVRRPDSVQKHVDARALQEYERELRELKAELENAQAENNEPTQTRVQEEIDALKTVLKNKAGISGDAGERARDNVRKAITAVLAKLRKGSKPEKDFEQHVAGFITTGYECMYKQPKTHVWE
jgi:hypothetical protein